MPARAESGRACSGADSKVWYVGTYSLVSPYTGESDEFNVWSGEVQTVHDMHFKMHRSNELIETIIFLCYENEELLQDTRLTELINVVQPNQADSLQCLVEHFNEISSRYFRRHGPFSEAEETGSAGRRPLSGGLGEPSDLVRRGSHASTFTAVPGVAMRRVRHSRFLGHIVQLCYNRAVIEPGELNKQKPFSTQTYGETMFPFVEHMVKRLFFEPDPSCDSDPASPSSNNGIIRVDEFAGLRPKRIGSDDRFIDLGSGVGQVVLQLAASVAYERPVIGIEKASVPQQYADNMAHEFVKCMRFFGRGYSPFVLIGDDFLDSAYADLIKRSTVVFANNFLFGPRVDLQLTELFSEMPEGARVVSSKRFCDEPSKITERTVNDISAIMRVDTFDAFVGAVSWTSSAFSFYLQTIDRTRLEHYFYLQRHRANANLSDCDSPRLLQSHFPPVTNGYSSETLSTRTDSANSTCTSTRRRRPPTQRTQPRVTRLIADDDTLQLQTPLPYVSVATSLDCSTSSVCNSETTAGDKRAKLVDALRKRILASRVQQSTEERPVVSPAPLAVRRKRKHMSQETDSQPSPDTSSTSSVLALFHAQTDAITNSSSDSSPAVNQYPSSMFNLREYDESSRERNQCPVVRLADTLRPPSTPTASSCDASISNSPSTPTSSSISRSSSTSGVFSAERNAPVNRDENDSEGLHELSSSAPCVSERPASPSSLIDLLRTRVTEQRATNVAVSQKTDILSRFISQRRGRLEKLLNDYEALESDESTERGDEPAGRLLTHYAVRTRAASDAQQRRSELLAQIDATRNALEISHSVLTGSSNSNPNFIASPATYSSVSPSESSSSSPTHASACASNLLDTRAPAITLTMSNAYPHYATLCQSAPLSFGSVNRLPLSSNALLHAYAPGQLMQQNIAVGGNVSVASTVTPQFPAAFFNMLPPSHTNGNVPFYPALYATSPHAL